MSTPAAKAPTAVQQLTAAALLLPGLALTLPAQADEAGSDSFTLHSAQYQEGRRSVPNAPSSLAPLRADTLAASAQTRLNADWSLQAGFSQDTWSGATPVSTAPGVMNGNRPIQQGNAGQLVTVGASPMLTGRILTDRNGQPLPIDPVSGKALPASSIQPVHTLSSASPESRRQLDLGATRRLPEGSVTLGGSVSQERDFLARTVQGNRRWEINDRHTTLTLGASLGHSSTFATLDHDAAPYLTKTAYADRLSTDNGRQTLHGDRREHSLSLNLTQVVRRDALFTAGLAFQQSRGYLANPYKATTVIFADPSTANAAGQLSGDVRALLEQRPDSRRSWALSAGWLHYIAPFDAALKLGWRGQRDDWGIVSHSLDGEWRQPLGNGWQLTPSLRYYAQTAARFYTPYLTTLQAYRQVSFDAQGQPVVTPFSAALLPAHFSSDHRLGAFGSLGAGLAVSKVIAPGIQLDGGIAHYRQAGSLKHGGGMGSYADFSYSLAHLSLRVDLDERMQAKRWAIDYFSGDGAPPVLHHHASHADAPAGVMFGHFLDHPGQWMLGYRQELRRTGRPSGSDASLIASGCGATPCYSVAERMDMTMHMLDIGYAVNERLNLMLMPQYLTMTMRSQSLSGAPLPPAGTVIHSGEHDSSGLGDTLLAATLRLHQSAASQWLLTLGLSAPTGGSGLKQRRMHQQEPNYRDYAMQTGSGTWDFRPHLTWLGQFGPWSGGAQLNLSQALQTRNSTGYALGRQTQASAWLNQPLGDTFTASLRAIVTQQQPIRTAFGDTVPATLPTQPADLAANSGGRTADLGFGLSARLPASAESNWDGGRLALEWLHPVRSQLNGTQGERRGTLYLNASLHF